MSASALLTAFAEYVGDVIVNDCGRPIPDRTLRYHGLSGMPQDCCSENGYLVVSWDRGYPSDSFPVSSGSKGAPVPGRPTLILSARYVICWPLPDANADGVRVIDDSWDARAALLADVEDGVVRALLRLSCESPASSPFASALLALVPCDGFAFSEALPINPGGGCAGVLWRAYAQPLSHS